MTADLISEVPALHTQLLQYEHVIWSPSIAGDLYTGPPETLEARTAVAALTGLINAAERAKQAAKLAQSWRDFRVGASAVMYNFETGYMAYLDGQNIKPESGQGGLNLHAEQVALAKGRAQGLNRALAIAVFADPLDEDANPYSTATLRPCGRCVGMFESAPEIDDNLLILSTNPQYDKCELYTFGGLKRAVKTETTFEHEMLVGKPFSLETEEDLEKFDRNIKPYLTVPIHDLYTKAA